VPKVCWPASKLKNSKSSKKFKEVQRSSPKFNKVQQSSTKFNKVQSSKKSNAHFQLGSICPVDTTQQRKSKEATIRTIYDFAVVAAGCSRAPQWKNVVFDISPNRR
jgi:hypothetical protein